MAEVEKDMGFISLREIPTERADRSELEFQAGQVFTALYPFVRDTYTTYDEEGGYTVPTWRPGVRYEDCGPEDVEPVADAVGKVEFTVVDCFKPGRFPTRVFLTRRFVTPEGKVFGKGKLHIWTAEKLRRLKRGFQVPYRVAAELDATQAGTKSQGDGVDQ